MNVKEMEVGSGRGMMIGQTNKRDWKGIWEIGVKEMKVQKFFRLPIEFRTGIMLISDKEDL
jgi:hypothetical protein